MKLIKIIQKNFTILFRSKSSAFVVLIGPLLIIALISLALSNTQEYKINVGIVAPDNLGLTEKFITQLEKNEYILAYYSNIDECTRQIKLKTTNLCIKFPKNFILENNKTYQVDFHVDQSRINIVESIVSSVKSSIALKTDEISLGLTNNLIDTIILTEEEIGKEKELIANLEEFLATGEKDTEKIKASSEKISADLDSTDEQTKEITSSTEALKTETNTLLTDLDDFIDKVEDLEDSPSTTKIKGDYDILVDLLPAETTDINEAVDELEKSIESIVSQIGSNEDSGIRDSAKKLETSLSSIKTKVDEIKGSLQTSEDKINEIEITSASSIVNPFTINVNPVLSISDKSTLMFPYFVTLIILFVGLMLSSTMVVMEKKSRAFFRTFTTPTSEVTHVIAGYVTNFIVISVQLSIVLVAAFYYLKVPIFNNFQVTLINLILSVSFFILLGTLIGYMFKTQEGTTIASISVGSISLFLSNIILPIESFPAMIRKILIFNPFILCSELFKKSMLFNARFFDLKTELLILISYIIVIIVLVFVFQKISINRLFSGFTNRKILCRPHITKDNSLRLPDGSLIKTRVDLYHSLKNMDPEIYKGYVSKKNNEFSVWVKDTFKDKKLAKLIKKAHTQERTVNVVEDYVKDLIPTKETKKQNKKRGKKRNNKEISKENNVNEVSGKKKFKIKFKFSK